MNVRSSLVTLFLIFLLFESQMEFMQPDGEASTPGFNVVMLVFHQGCSAGGTTLLWKLCPLYFK